MVSFTVDALCASVTAEPVPAWRLVDGAARPASFVGLDELRQAVLGGALDQGAELLAAAVLAAADAGIALAPAHLSFSTTIPRQVGLSGSSAIVIGALRALGQLAGHRWDPVTLARVALAAETTVLGLAAGPQDRVVQAIGGLVDMDFARPWQADAYRRLEPTNLPPLLVAWTPDGGESSSIAHSDLRAQWDRGDPAVHDTMAQFRRLGELGAALLERPASGAELAPLVDEAYELRSRVWSISESDRRFVAMARRHDAGAALAGSGGAVVVVPRSPETIAELEVALTAAGAVFLRPFAAAGGGAAS